MPEKYVAQYKEEEDGCVYFVNAETGKMQKICDIESPADLPPGALRYFKGIFGALDSVLGRG